MRKIIIATLLGATALISAELNIYSARHYDADFEIYKKFEAQTGIKVNHTTAKAPASSSFLAHSKMYSACSAVFPWIL